MSIGALETTVARRILESGFLVLLLFGICLTKVAHATPPALVTELATAEHTAPAFDALVSLGDRAVPALSDGGCEPHSDAARGRIVLVLQQIGTRAAGQALRKIGQCTVQDAPEVHRWAILAAIAVANDPADLIQLYDGPFAFPELREEIEAAALERLNAGDFKSRHWLMPASEPSLTSILTPRMPQAVPVARVARAMAQHQDAAVRAQAAEILLALPPGHEGLGRALIEAHRFEPTASAPLWADQPHIARFTLTNNENRELSRELIAWMLTAPLPKARRATNGGPRLCGVDGLPVGGANLGCRLAAPVGLV